jgi:predicted HAD superfamily Cof-like phosphohydrolase
MSQRCARPGCRAWAMRGAAFCRAHRDEEEGSARSRSERSEAFAKAVRAGDIHALIEQAVQQVISQAGADLSLEREIGALRIVLSRVIAMDALHGDPAATAATVARLVDSIVRTVKTQRAISGDLADDLAGALTTILIEMGLGEEQ